MIFQRSTGNIARQCNQTSVPESSSACGLHPNVPSDNSSRRRFLQMSVGGTVAGLTTAVGIEVVAPHRVLAQTALSPDAALQELMDGNKRFTALRLTACEHDLAILKQHTTEKQEPFASVLSCADSRVPIELLFDQSIGHISLRASPGISPLRRLLPALNMALEFWGQK